MSDTTSTEQAPPPRRQGPPVKFVNRHDVAETFVDTITGVIFDGQTLRIDGAVTRVERADGQPTVVAAKYTACRIVLTPNAAAELISQLQQVTAKLRQVEAAKKEQAEAAKT
jgi:hypothetical protein